MAKVRGGVYGRPSGLTGGVVWGAARDRQGKVATMRAHVIPANPNTAAQQTQRTKFSDVLDVVRNIGPTEYQDAWNRSIGQLPGFQSLMSILLDNIDVTFGFSEPPDTPLGTLHFPGQLIYTPGPLSGEITADWTTELGQDGTAADIVHMFAIEADRDIDDEHPVIDASDSKTRTDATCLITGLDPATSYLTFFYLEGAGTAAGINTLAQWDITTSLT